MKLMTTSKESEISTKGKISYNKLFDTSLFSTKYLVTGHNGLTDLEFVVKFTDEKKYDDLKIIRKYKKEIERQEKIIVNRDLLLFSHGTIWERIKGTLYSLKIIRPDPTSLDVLDNFLLRKISTIVVGRENSVAISYIDPKGKFVTLIDERLEKNEFYMLRIHFLNTLFSERIVAYQLNRFLFAIRNIVYYLSFGLSSIFPVYFIPKALIQITSVYNIEVVLLEFFFAVLPPALIYIGRKFLFNIGFRWISSLFR